MTTSVLVTGAAGYLGSVLIPALLERGCKVIALDTFERGDTALAHVAADPNFEPIRGDARDENLLGALLPKVDLIIPLAALVGAPLCKQDPIAAKTINLEAILSILKLRSNDQRIIYPTTNSGYGIGQKGVFCTEETPLNPISLCGTTKVDAERAILDSGNGVTLRLATVFGMAPRMRRICRSPSRPRCVSASRRFTRVGVALSDFDNDGNLDLYEANGRVGRQSEPYSSDPYAEPNLLFRGFAGPRFEEVTPRGGTRSLLVAASRAAAFGDIDNDGGIDIVVVNRDGGPYVLHNIVQPRGHWATFRVVDEHRRDALGAEVTMAVGAHAIRRDVRAAYSYMASNDPRVHVGLGQELIARNVIVKWPDGTRERFGDISADRVALLRRGSGLR